jgi:hypothetical protein
VPFCGKKITVLQALEKQCFNFSTVWKLNLFHAKPRSLCALACDRFYPSPRLTSILTQLQCARV